MASNRFIDDAFSGIVVCDIGQVSKDDARALDKLVRAGALKKWRGHWFPVAGADYGLGPLKTCWAIPPIAECFAA